MSKFLIAWLLLAAIKSQTIGSGGLNPNLDSEKQDSDDLSYSISNQTSQKPSEIETSSGEGSGNQENKRSAIRGLWGCSDGACYSCDSDPGLCDGCVNTYGVSSELTCVRCSDRTNCLLCDGDNPHTCWTCKNSEDPVNGACTTCTDTHCSTCADVDVCTVCNNYYGAISNGCQQCTDSINCLNCDSNISKCKTCKNGKAPVNDACTACSDSNCKTCSDVAVCTACNNYYRVNSNACEKCSNSHCLKCDSNASTCTSCENYYGVVSNSCVACSDSINCLNCDGDVSKCKTCKNGKSPDGSGKCTTCTDSNCKTCSDVAVCTACNNYYRVNSNACEKCSNSHCLKCDNNANTCTSCDNYYGVVSNSCVACSDSTHCLNCDGAAGTCITCKPGYTIINGKCCATANNCGSCSSNSNICDSCAVGSFLYQESATSTKCIGNFYLACSDSCTSCQPGPNCYACADSIVQNGNTCMVNKVGYEISFEYPNIVIDFAYPLSAGLSKNSFKATSNPGGTISTANWSFTGCTVGSKQCIIGTDNVTEADLPFDLDIEFTQV